MKETTPLPVSVVGGFLGAGKTSLLNRLLKENEGRRLGLIVNDFGDINIDEKLIIARDENMISLANGCICCSIGSDFLRALVALVTRPDPPEQIVIEASGVANPARIASVARADRSLRLQSILVLVDALNFRKHLADPLLKDTLEGQVRAADLLVFTKTDIAGDEDVTEALHAVRGIAPLARTISSSVASLPVGVLFDLEGQSLPQDLLTPAPHHPFWSGSLVSERPCNLDLLRRALAGLPPSLLRLKGVVCDLQGVQFSVQWVAGRLSIAPHAMGKPSGHGELVYIGVGEEDASVKEMLASAFG